MITSKDHRKRPHIPADVYVVWHAVGKDISYLSSTRKCALRGHALFTKLATNAAMFETEAEARKFLDDNNAMRPGVLRGINVTTVAEMHKIVAGGNA